MKINNEGMYFYEIGDKVCIQNPKHGDQPKFEGNIGYVVDIRDHGYLVENGGGWWWKRNQLEPVE